MLLRVMGSDLSTSSSGPERAVNGVTRRLADTSAAREELGFEAEVDLEEGLRPARRVVAPSARDGASRRRWRRRALMEVPFATPVLLGRRGRRASPR